MQALLISIEGKNHLQQNEVELPALAPHITAACSGYIRIAIVGRPTIETADGLILTVKLTFKVNTCRVKISLPLTALEK
ncbi:MAG: hypothetical protein IPP15_23365 [Saprospiraceae bacterium]|uniref:Uncharacterized protein n=1 Tax=Candidatus Opimibacter skivensis TaxID=2982028 RepID=A0A9D7SZL9_9BACT|nr:hypothetical protein [Candidatus Opimibacter skivensis]